MATRRSSARSRRTAGGASRATGRSSSTREQGDRSPRVDRDGKLTIDCPHCGNKYKVPEEILGSSLTCRNCRRTFLARPPGERRRSGAAKSAKSDNRTYMAIGGAIVALFAIVLILANMEGQKVEMAPPAVMKKTVNIRWDNARVQSAVTWVRAIHDTSELLLERYADLAALQKFLEIEPGQDFATAPPDARTRISQAVLAALKTGPRTAVFREWNPTDGQLASVADATGETGTVELSMAPWDPTKYGKQSSAMGALRAEVALTFRADGDDIRFTGWTETRVPRTRAPRQAAVKTHDKIAAPEVREVDFGGQKVKIEESEPCPLEHLAETPADQRGEIDQLIVTAMDTTEAGYKVNRARRRLVEIGKPAIPRLLNQMFEYYEKHKGKEMGRDDRLALVGVVHTLRDITGVAFGYNPADRGSSGIGGTDSERFSALKQWYAWWYRNAHRKDFRNYDDAEDETLFDVGPKKDTTGQSKVMK